MINFASPLFGGGEGGPTPPTGPIDPATLFVGNMVGAWWDPSDISTMRQGDTAGSAAAVVDSRVGYLADKSGNGCHLTQGGESARPFLRTAGGLYWLEFDGVDDFLVRAGSPGAVGDIFFALTAPADSSYMMGYSVSGGSSFFGLAQAGNASATHLDSGVPALLVNGAPVANERDDLHATIGSAPAVHELQGANVSAWSGFEIGNYGSFEFSGRLHGAVLIGVQPAGNRIGLRKWLGDKAGLVL